MKPTVAVVIVNWNGEADTLACLASLAASAGGPWPTIVVDNGSADGSVGAIRAAYPDVEVIEAGENLGFTGGNNLGTTRALAAGTDYLWLLNNDTVVEPTTVITMVGEAERHVAFGIFTPVVHYFDRKDVPWFAGSRLDLATGVAVHDNHQPPDRSDDVRAIPWASGCALFIRRSAMERLHGFDDRYFLNWEDVDLSIRAERLCIGIALVPAARIYHKVGQSFAMVPGAGMYYYVRNHLLLVSLHARQRVVVTVAGRHLRAAVRMIVRRQPMAWRTAIVIGRAVADFARGRFGRLQEAGASA